MNTFEKVYTLVRIIPKGKVSTYGNIARILSISPRVVGFALHANKDPYTIPCYRVVNKNGQLAKGHAFGGRDGQRKKLEKEGIGFLDKTHVNLEQHLYLLNDKETTF